MITGDKIVYLEERLEEFPKFPLSLVPTPCHRLNSLSETYGTEIYCKRDDLTGFGLGGNKSRKLELLIGEALENGCDTVVTSGGIQSNFCRLTAAAGAAAGMSVSLVLGGKRPVKPTGNLVLDNLLGAQIRYVDSPDWNDWETESEALSRELTEQGQRVFRIPIGGSVPVGVVGYITAFLEILNDEKRLGVTFNQIIHASGSGGTQAGLVVGKDMTGWKGLINGISVAMYREELEEKVFKLAHETAGILGGNVTRESVLVEDGFIGPGYSIPTAEGEKAIEVLARREGIFLDRVYTGKAASALLNWLEQGKLSGQRILFLHTGGHPELFA
ncbi:MAG: D-cysteine desulfhydrase family protein [Deltaproteobacteria bacterium]|nr:D-cysteine desulfhydrase family protein [Deltaproteobacteria bacterium]MBW1908760.1 D-cysteine desulfhydrase family protein [Deltaproteobacteria bacterium]MBW2034639.1 D-cysteine desulfhydrase family protein [Deltaproteobacteria bacterium]MBW2114996.1 D-cysteine desulfhydrase family protein [Deltaproteobacteria bacterium]MBW2358584.1 D-cysteine desulfhydrase family protein [Deltaproteobacteria bacterium]